MARELGIAGSVLFAGAIPDPAAAYRGMDLFALSSDTEQMPFSVMEAMATGLAVASTEVGDVRAMVAEESRAHVGPLTDEGLAAALRPLLLDAGRRQRARRADAGELQQVW